MSEDTANRLNIYDYFGFPNPQQRVEARNIFDMEKLSLITVTDSDLWISDIFSAQYNTWSYHINNFRSHLGLHLLLMYYQYEQKPFDVIGIKNFQSPKGAHKVLFDTFAEDASLYLISYFDKHLEMFNDLFYLNNGKKHLLSRNEIITKMKKIDEINGLGIEYDIITESQPFKAIKRIRDDFVHNKSSTYSGMNIARLAEGEYSGYNSKGISTQETYKAICELVSSYEHLCVAVNNFINKRISEAK
jgi:hypothetical protein